ncbi:hypothetical protein ELI_0417 [Eubacterium callanderi]|uniref:Uncharacterized protein n=1 Tax=Eubacterium callanderi TaxID=53442 RepID=E3GIE9_9FIRM|nr:hypothetical protein ELI_0417 [Eubacterium callanderi]
MVKFFLIKFPYIYVYKEVKHLNMRQIAKIFYKYIFC